MNTETQDTQSTIYNHSFTHVPLPLLFLPVCGWLIAVPTFLDMGNLKCSCAFSEMSYINDRKTQDIGHHKRKF